MLAKDTQIYIDVYDLCNVLFGYTIGFRKELRSSLALRIQETLLDMSTLIVKANSNIDRRVEYLNDFVVKYELLQFLVNLSVDKHQITLKQQAFIARMLVGIGKQAIKWRQFAEAKRKKTNV